MSEPLNKGVIVRLALPTRASRIRPDLYTGLGVVIGIIMPLLSAAIYPVYMHQMQPAWAEWTRLMELPFVACEIVFIQVAIARGYRDTPVLAALPRDVIAALALLAIGLVVSSAFVSRNVPASLTLSLTTIVHLRFAAAMYFLARSARKDQVETLFHYFGLGLVALAILTAVKFLLPPPAWTVPGGQIEWASALPGFISVRHFGSWTGAIAAGALIAVLYGKERSAAMRWLYLLAASMTFWSGTRAAVVALAVVTMIVLATLRRLPAMRDLRAAIGLSALAMLVAIALFPGLPEFTLYQRGDMHSADAFAAGRFELWHDTFFRWLDAPIFGWGSGSTFWEVNIGWAHTQPHNAFLQFLISWGVVGAAGAVWLLGRAIVATHRIGMDDDALRPLSSMVYSLLFMSMLEGMLYYPRFIMAIMMGLAVLIATRAQGEQT